MAAKRPRAKKPSSKRPGAEKVRPTGETTESRVLLLFEQMQGEIRGIADGVIGLDRRLEEWRDELRTQIDEKTQILGVAIRQNSADIRQNTADIRQNSEGLVVVKQAVERIELALESKASSEKVDALEQRVSRLESAAQ